MWTMCAAAWAAGVLCAPAWGDGVFYYDGLTPEENEEVVAWSMLYWQRVDQGGGAPGDGFSFTNPLMNSQLFNPIRSARATLEFLGQIDPNLCDRLYELPVGLDAQTVEWRARIRDLMLTGELVTEEGTPEDWEHLLLVEAFSPDVILLRWLSGEWTYEEWDGFRVTTNVPLMEVSEVALDAALALEISEDSQNIIASLIATSGYWRAQCTDIPQWRSLITGETSTADQYRAIVNNYLGFLDNPDLSTQLIQANFGTFGELPVIGVRLSDCYILMDPTSGNLSGPFESDSPLDARGLLSMHEEAFEVGGSVRYYTSLGCSTAVAATWHPGSGPTGPFTCPGCGPWTPPAPAWFFCNIDWLATPPGTVCRCIGTDISTDPAGRAIPSRLRCEGCTGCGGTTGPGTGWNPVTVPAVPPGCTPPCQPEYFY
jgi:hypothetical protein